MSSLREAVALLRDEQLVWSEDMEVIRRPLADLLAKIERQGVDGLQGELDDLLLPLLGYEPVDAPRDPMEAWLGQAYKHLNMVEAVAERSPSFTEALKKLFRAL